MNKFRFSALLLSASLLIAACSTGASPSAPTTPGGLSLSQVRLAMDNDDYMNQLGWMVAEDKYWPALGFTKKASVVASGEYIAGLVGGDVWIAQGESQTVWAALAEGSIPLTVVGVEKDQEAWFLGIRKGVDKNNLKGLKISGGPVGDRNVTVGKNILGKLGVNPKDLTWVNIAGGSDDRLQAMLAGRIDVAVLQPRHLIPLKKAGGEMIVQDYMAVPQEVWIVKKETMEKNKDAVCAYLEGRIAAKQWASQGATHTDNRDAAIAIAKKYGQTAGEGDIAEWESKMVHNWALTGGSPLAALDQWNQDMIDMGDVPKGFDWKKFADFSCVTKAQEKLGLKVEPGVL